jgi:aspartyl-tRNA synthetase
MRSASGVISTPPPSQLNFLWVEDFPFFDDEIEIEVADDDTDAATDTANTAVVDIKGDTASSGNGGGDNGGGGGGGNGGGGGGGGGGGAGGRAGAKRWTPSKAMHHPFTAPRAADADKLHRVLDGQDDEQHTLAREVRGRHYDLVCNGVELGGGSIRVHDAALQKRIFNVGIAVIVGVVFKVGLGSATAIL